MAPDELATALDVADILNGQLPHWHRGGPDHVPAEPIDEEFERRLEQAKRAAAGLEEPDAEDDDPEEDDFGLTLP